METSNLSEIAMTGANPLEPVTPTTEPTPSADTQAIGGVAIHLGVECKP